MATVITTSLRNGTKVYAADTKKYGIQAKTYINDTQAEKAAAKLQAAGVKCSVYFPVGNMRVRFIRIED